MSKESLRAPFPWFGGKSRAAPLIWRAFGNVPNYVEPFAGSLAVLLARPGGSGKVETANDKDGFICNVWRAIASTPDEVAHHANWPVNEADLHARHQWLVSQGAGLLERLIADPEYSDPKIAGWWIWGICTWIGNGWCSRDERLKPARARPGLSAPGRGIHRMVGTPGNGIHAPSRKKPLTHRNKGVHRDGAGDLAELFSALSDRLRGVRVCCGDWTRVLGRSTLGIDTPHGMTPCGVLLDGPYAHDEREKRLYREDDPDLSAAVRTWALENGSNPALRIALCGWDTEHGEAMPPSWRCVAWKGNSSAWSSAKERIWFSPHCLPVDIQAELALGGVG